MARKVIEIEVELIRHFDLPHRFITKDGAIWIDGDIIKGLKSQIKPGGKRYVTLQLIF